MADQMVSEIPRRRVSQSGGAKNDASITTGRPPRRTKPAGQGETVNQAICASGAGRASGPTTPSGHSPAPQKSPQRHCFLWLR